MKRFSVLVVSVLFMIFYSGCAKKVKPKKEVSKPAKAEMKVGEKKVKERKAEVGKVPGGEKVFGVGEEKVSISAKKKEVQVIEGKEEFKLEDIHFDFDRYTIKTDDAKYLQKLADWLKKNPNIKILIEGHCDERGTEEYNFALGQRRAESAKRFLVSLGVNPDRLSTISYGELKPLDPRHCEEAWAKNRRDHFVVVGR